MKILLVLCNRFCLMQAGFKLEMQEMVIFNLIVQ